MFFRRGLGVRHGTAQALAMVLKRLLSGDVERAASRLSVHVRFLNV